MQLALVFLLIGGVSFSAFAQEQMRFSFGGGVEGRAEREINPEIVEAKALPHFYARSSMGRWSAGLESGYQKTETSSGGLKIRTRSIEFGIWGRYTFKDPFTTAPFVSTGAGMFFDRVEATFADQGEDRGGTRGFFGLGAGLSHPFAEHFQIEGELRVLAQNELEDPSVSAYVRLGVSL